MKIIVIGATGTIGSAVADALAAGNDVVRASSSSGEVRVDLGSKESIQELFESITGVDAVVSAAGQARFGALAEQSDDDFYLGVTNKLLGQVNLVRVGMHHLADNGSITLTSGMLSHHPAPGTSSVSMVGAALESFVKAASLEMPRGIRVNVVSPPFVKETMDLMGMDSTKGMPAAEVARAYVESVAGSRSGETLEAQNF